MREGCWGLIQVGVRSEPKKEKTQHMDCEDFPIEFLDHRTEITKRLIYIISVFFRKKKILGVLFSSTEGLPLRPADC